MSLGWVSWLSFAPCCLAFPRRLDWVCSQDSGKEQAQVYKAFQVWAWERLILTSTALYWPNQVTRSPQIQGRENKLHLLICSIIKITLENRVTRRGAELWPIYKSLQWAWNGAVMGVLGGLDLTSCTWLRNFTIRGYATQQSPTGQRERRETVKGWVWKTTALPPRAGWQICMMLLLCLRWATSEREVLWGCQRGQPGGASGLQ